MCKCCECCNKCKTKTYLDDMLKQSSIQVNERNIRMKFVSRNIPIILDLVWKYNKLIEDEPKTYEEANRLSQIRESLAVQIVNYCR